VALLASGIFAAPDKTEKLGKPSRMCMYACNDVVGEATFGYKATPDVTYAYYGSICRYPPAIGSMTICAANFFGEYTKNFNKTLEEISHICRLYAGSNDTAEFFYEQYENATSNIISTEGLNLTTYVFHAPFSVPKEDTQVYYHYLETVYYNWDMPSLYASFFYFYFIFVFVLLGIANYLKILGYHRRLTNKWINKYRKYISIPALFNKHHTDAPVFLKIFSTLVPTRVETIIIFFFVCLNVLLASVHYDVITIYNDRVQQLNILVADRTGLLSFGLVPMLILFAGRNNILIRLTGLPYTSFIVFHKWVSRLMFLHALIHSCCWTAYAVAKGYLSYYVEDAYWVWGIVATTLAGLICFQAFHVFRTISYEIFLAIHIIFASMFIVSCWWHCYDLGYLEWIYASIALWCVDRILRVLRMVSFGFRDAKVEYISDETFKVTVQKGRFFDSFPGSFAYLYFFTPYGFWQSHPFTIIDSALQPNEITMYIKAKKGMTNYIKNKCIKAGGRATIKVSVEGPYGHHAPTHKYDTALLLAGGNGIPGPYYHAMDLAKRDSSSKQQIKLLWSVREPEALCWFFEELKAFAYTSVQCDIYITGPLTKKHDSERDKQYSSSDAEAVTSGNSLDYQTCIQELSSFITFHYQRPALEEIIVSEFTHEQRGPICVMSCGPPKMVDTIRKVFGSNLDKASHRVDLFEELQVW
jgi:ferric-chelate reductase